jgi:hypothetical protein
MVEPAETRNTLISIENGLWYYFTVDLDFEGFASFKFVRYIKVNGDRRGAIVEFQDQDYFRTRHLLLLPYTREADYFQAPLNAMLSVWTFDASTLGDTETVDLQAQWPGNILDKAAITPSIDTAIKWTQTQT